MGRNPTKSPEEKDAENGVSSKKDRSGRKSKRKIEVESETDSESEEGSKHSSRSKRKKRSRSKRRTSRNDDDSHSSYSDDEDSESESESSEYSSEEERRMRKRRERKRREEREEKERRRRRKEKEKRKKKKDRDEGDKKKRKKKKDSERGKKGAVTDSWGKYGIIRDTDMWNKRPEFTAWLAEVKQVNLESLPNWEEKQMFKQFMEDHNTATFPSKKYYNLDAYFKRQMEKEMKKGVKKVQTERTVFNDEEIRRQEMQQVRERHKEEQVEALKREMQSGMAQAMKEQAQLREEMAYQYKLGNFEAAAAIQRRLDPDVPM